MPNLHVPCIVAPSEADFYRLVAERTPAMLAVVGADERYVFANEAYAQAFGCEAASLLGCSLREVFGDTYARIAVQVQTALAGASASFTGLIASNQSDQNLTQLKTATHTQALLEIQLQPVFDSAREVIYVLLSATALARTAAA